MEQIKTGPELNNVDPILACQVLGTEMDPMKFEAQCKTFLLRKYSWKCHLQNVCHFVQALMC